MRRNTFIGAMALLDANVDGTLLTPSTNPPKRTSHLGKLGVQKHFLTARFLPRRAKLSARLLLRFFLKGKVRVVWDFRKGWNWRMASSVFGCVPSIPPVHTFLLSLDEHCD